MLDVERWAELRREHFVRGVSIKELSRRTSLDRNTVRRALRASEPPRYSRPTGESKLDPFKDEIHRLLREDPKLPGVRVRELIEPLGENRRGYVVVACLGYSRAGAGALVFSKRAPDLIWGIARCLWSLGGLPQALVWDREGALHARDGRPTDEFAAFCGRLKVDWRFCEAADPQAKGVVERLQGYLETNFERGRRFANPADFQLQLDDWFGKANARTHKALRCRPVDRLGAEREAMDPLPAFPDLDRRVVTRVPAQPFVRVDTCDYSLDPRLVGRRVEVRVSQTEVLATALDTGELAARHERSFARHRTITALDHGRLLRERRAERSEPAVETRPLAHYDRLIGA